MKSITQKLIETREALAEASKKAGRGPSAITLVAISKTHSVDQVQEAVDVGHCVFGESYLQEALKKSLMLPKNLSWHLIGRLQTNKIRKALELFSLVQSVHSLELAKKIDRISGEKGVSQNLLLEVNVSGEMSKLGFSPESLEACAEELFSLQYLQVEGLMTVVPYTAIPLTSRPFFARLREFRDRLSRRIGKLLNTLSMGTSNDYQIAVEEGATMVRVGDAIFGKRISIERF